MSEENRENLQSDSGAVDNGSGAVDDYINTIKELKANSVSKADYEKLKEEKSKLVQALANGETLEKEEKPSYDIKQLRKDLFGEDSNLSNIEYAKKALQLRQAVISEGGVDPFLPYGNRIKPDDNDIEKAENVAKVFQECIDFAEGDNELFTNELMRRTVDSAPMAPKKKIKR